MRNLALASIFLFTAACGGDSGDGGTGDPDAAIPGSVSVVWGPITVPAGTEDTRCVIKKLGNETQLRVGSIHNVLGATSHHFIIYRIDDQPEQATPYACNPFTDTLDPAKGAPLMITQKSEETLTLPDGVAFSLAPNQTVRLEMHFINASDSDSEVTATSTFVPIADADFRHEADFLFIGNVDVSVPPGEATLGPTYFPLPTDLADSKFFALTGHEHQWGTDVSVATTTGSAGSDTLVYDLPNFNWDEPETVYHDPPFEVPGGGGFRFTCAWNNLSGTTVGFGEGADDEMCFFWAYYYPSKGARVCAHTDQFGGIDVCCPGNPTICNNLF
ncbi:MAG TPA: hypothetical protein VML75_25710 [Kofleriaceae bacterium]|nr:hypothetical protein [Kofleriaceae bacterium]